MPCLTKNRETELVLIYVKIYKKCKLVQELVNVPKIDYCDLFVFQKGFYVILKVTSEGAVFISWLNRFHIVTPR